MTRIELKKLLDNMSDDVRRLNPDIRTHKVGKGAAQAAPSSRVTDTFLSMWEEAAPDITLVTEHRFHKTRKWRFDFAHPESHVAIEYNGGVWSGGRHNRGAGYLKDLEKVNEAQALGWVVFQLGTGMVTTEKLREIAQFIRSRHESAGENRDDGFVDDDGP